MLRLVTPEGKEQPAMVRSHLLHNATAIFRRPIGEVLAPAYNTSFKKLAELAIAGNKAANFRFTLVRTEMPILPEFLLFNQVALEHLAEDKTIEEIGAGNDHAKVVIYTPGVVPIPLRASYISPLLRGPLHVYLAAGHNDVMQVWDASEKGTLITGEWSFALNVAQTTADTNGAATQLLIPDQNA